MKISSLISTIALSAALGGLTACTNSSQLDASLESAYQCVSAPESITKIFTDARKEGRIPIFVTQDNKHQYSEADWYQAHDDYFEGLYTEYEDWNSLIELTDCRFILSTLKSEYGDKPKVTEFERFLEFAEGTYKEYGAEQSESANMALSEFMFSENICLYQETYPQAFKLMQFDTEADLYPGLFYVPWDDETATLDGRGFLGRPVPSVADSQCLLPREKLGGGWTDHALSSESLIGVSYSEYADHKNRTLALIAAVDSYNALEAQNYKDLATAGETIPDQTPYTSDVIYLYDGIYVAGETLNELVTECEDTPLKTHVNGRGETLYTFPQACRAVQAMCEGRVLPRSPESLCQRVQTATDLSRIQK